MDEYQLLANAIVAQAAHDYFDVLAGFPQMAPRFPIVTKEELEKFLHSQWYDILTTLDIQCFIPKIQEEASKMILEYTVAKEKGSNRYFVTKANNGERVSECYSSKKRALHAAAALQNMEYKLYMRIRRRDGLIDK